MYLDDLLGCFDGMEKSGHGSRLSYIGDKQKYLPLLLTFLPDFETLTEPYGGMGAVSRFHLLQNIADDELLDERRRFVYGDTFAENINLLVTIRDEPEELAARLNVVINDPSYFEFSRDHFASPRASNVERACRYLVNLNSGHHAHQKEGHTSGFTHKDRLHELPSFISIYARMFKRLTIEQSKATDLIRKYDSPTTLHFVDPCYVVTTRKHGSTRYAHEMKDADHHELLKVLVACEGKVCLCGYPSPIYDEYLADGRWETTWPLNKVPKPPDDPSDPEQVAKYEKQKAKWKAEVVWTNFHVDDDVRSLIYRQGQRLAVPD